ncbi:hypothetical protein B0H16DRAFT_1736230 [Mycena metata]|uniref:Uncharacterized protein n=1 Tax=Mycena metata TaxID=1033252 RepID=A0AAD7HQU2_9AGAR|nr:hypothetical protein B0H16DRAFT_1736230 [Mycena metata]
MFNLNFVAAARKLSPNPHLQPSPAYKDGTVSPSPPGSAASMTQTEKRLRNQLLHRTQFCIVTGSASTSLQPGYFLNATRKSETREEADERRKTLETYLTNRGILADTSFLLHSLPNMSLLKADIHLAWETYATVMICPPAAIFELARYFVYCNDLWQAETDKDNKVPEKRPLVDPPSPNFYVSALDFFVLHPSFLPNGEPLPVCTNPPYLTPTSPSSSPKPIWQSYVYGPKTSILVRKSSALPLTISVRNQLSSVAVIINADAKLRHAKSSKWTLTPSVVLSLKAIEVFKDAFFFTPSVKAKTSRHTPSEETGTEDIGNIIPPDVHVNQLQDEAESERPAERDPHDENKKMDLDGYEDEEEDSEDERSLSPEESRLALERLDDSSNFRTTLWWSFPGPVDIQDRMQIASLLFTGRPVPLPKRLR